MIINKTSKPSGNSKEEGEVCKTQNTNETKLPKLKGMQKRQN